MNSDLVVCRDAIEFLHGLPDECAGLIIADPPYSIPKEFGPTTHRRTFEEWLQWCKEWLAESIRVLSNHGNLMVYALHTSAAFLHVELSKLGLTYRRQIIWRYENGFSTYKTAPAAERPTSVFFSWPPPLSSWQPLFGISVGQPSRAWSFPLRRSRVFSGVRRGCNFPPRCWQRRNAGLANRATTSVSASAHASCYQPAFPS